VLGVALLLVECAREAREPEGETRKASIRERVEHPLRMIERQFGLMKVRFPGLAKNTAHVITLFALSNLWMAGGKLLAILHLASANREVSRMEKQKQTRIAIHKNSHVSK
jgi:IS5 family transposase